MQRHGRRVFLSVVAVAFALSILIVDCTGSTAVHRATTGTSEDFIRHDPWEKHVTTVRRQLENLGVAGAGAGAEPVPEGGTEPVEVHKAEKSDREVPETRLIQPIDTAFKPSSGRGKNASITFSALGEPKSGTTWLGRLVVELCVQLCGNPENTWCKMGGLTITNNKPAPRYDFDMLYADTDELFLHFQGADKHVIPGVGVAECVGDMRTHPNSFGRLYPCKNGIDLSREELVACLPALTPECTLRLSSMHPPHQRIAVIFRDARNLIISEHRMRREVYHQVIDELEPFILSRFQTVVAWIHQRFVWHTTALEAISHVIIYEDIQTNPGRVADLAASLGLDCAPKDAEEIFRMHTYADPPGDYTTYGLSIQTLAWMNATMSKTLPEALLVQYGLTPIWE